jgi:hypothetical protein
MKIFLYLNSSFIFFHLAIVSNSFSQDGLISINGGDYIKESEYEWREDLNLMKQKALDNNKLYTELDFVLNRKLTDKDVENKIIEQSKKVGRNGKLLVFFSDHGGREKNESYMIMGDYKISANQYKNIMKKIRDSRKDVTIISIFETCYSGGMLESVIDNQNPEKSCGFSSSQRDEYGYDGEGITDIIEEVKGLSNGFRFKSIASVLDVHDKNLLKKSKFDIPPSTYSTTSDVFLDKYLSQIKSSSGVYSKTINGLNSSMEYIKKNLLNSCTQNSQYDFISNLNFEIEFKQVIDDEQRKMLQVQNLANSFSFANYAKVFDINDLNKKISELNYKRKNKIAHISNLEFQRDELFFQQWPKSSIIRNEYLKSKPDLQKIDKLYEEFHSFKLENNSKLFPQNKLKLDKEENQLYKLSKEINILKKLSIKTKRLQALQAMYSKNDIEAIKKFMKIRKCEHSEVLK